MGRELMFIGLAFLLCGLFARAGSRVGLPTIPLFVAAGILVGPNTPGVVLFEHPEDLELLAAFGLIFLLFYLGVEFSVEQLTAGGSKLLAAAGIYLVLNIGGGLIMGFAMLGGWIVSSLHVYLRDTAQVITVVMTLWFWMTPIFISEEQVPERFRFLIRFNPLSFVVRAYRERLLSTAWPNLQELLIVALYAVAFFVVGGLFFRQLKRGFPDVL